MQHTLLYCYDAYCGWCYGFGSIIKKIEEECKDNFQFEVLSGGMIITNAPKHIGITAAYMQKSYKTIEEYTGVVFGEDYLWHVKNPHLSDWYPSSEKPAIALCIFKEFYPEKQVQFAFDLQYALHYEGRDLCDDESYRHLLEKYSIQAEIFYEKLKSKIYKEKAYYEFELCRRLQVKAFPTLLLQINESKFYSLATGFIPHKELKEKIENIIIEIQSVLN